MTAVSNYLRKDATKFRLKELTLGTITIAINKEDLNENISVELSRWWVNNRN